MFGNNPIRPPTGGDGTQLDVQGVFATLQGEGPYAGWPSVFVRLGGCNLACTFCDTEFESFQPVALPELLARIDGLLGPARLVVITGGEPLRQNIIPLCEALLARGLKVQLETNGTLMRPLPEGVDIVCSPKNTGNGYAPVRADLLARAQALKFIVSAQRADYSDIADVGQGPDLPVYVQPMDEYDETRNAANLRHAVGIARRRGCRLSIQLHKIAGIE